MTYCVGVKLEQGLIFASDSRTHAGVDNDARFCKMTVMQRRFEEGDDYFDALTRQWIAGTRQVFHELPPLQW